MMIATRDAAAEIEPSQRVVFYPTFGWRVPRGWEVLVHGAVFREGVDDYRRRVFMGLLRRVLQLSPEDYQSEIFRQRVAGFLAREQPGQRLALKLGSDAKLLSKRTRGNGHVRAKIRISDDQLEQLARHGCLEQNWLRFQAINSPGDARSFAGSACLIPPTGLSVVSDIDDTLKLTGVGERKLMLANTFLREFQVVHGMPALFRQWAQSGAAFHYVSSSPWQLFEPLHDLLRLEGYPAGTFHLKSVRFRDPSVLRLLVARRRPKRRAIISILRRYPHRRFVLVGDSGEKDPEIYGAMARKFPHQVARIFIRNVARRPLQLERADRAFRKLPAGTWRVFRDPHELSEMVNPLAGFSLDQA